MNEKRLMRLKLIREGELKRAERAYIARRDALRLEQERVNDMKAMVLDYLSTPEGVESSQTLRDRVRFVSSLRETIVVQEAHLARVAQEVESLRQIWTRGRGNVRALENALEKCASDHKRSTRRKEERAQVWRPRSIL